MKLRSKILVAAVIIAASVAAYAASVKCPIDNFDMYFTGKTKSEMGKLLQEHKCANGHVAWVVN